MWFPYNTPQSIPFNTSFAIDSATQFQYKLPSIVMATAVKPMNNVSLDFEVDIVDPILQCYIYLHFVELDKLQENEYREFNINLNGKPWLEASVVPNYLYSTTIYSTVPVRGPKLKFSINKTENSTLPPILNAMEVYIVKDFFQAPTDQEDGMLFLHKICCRSTEMQLYYVSSFCCSYIFTGLRYKSIQFVNNVGVY